MAAAPSRDSANAVEGPRFTAINPDAFKDGFSVDVLLTYLARDVVKHKHGSRTQLEGGTAPLVVKASLDKVQRLVGTLDRAEEELQALQGEISRKVSQLQLAIKRQESTYQTGIEEAEDIGDRVRSAYKEVEGAANRISQVGIRIGDRLQSADAVRSRAIELVSLLSHLHDFSQLNPPLIGTTPEEVFKKLPTVFWDDKSLAEAAGLARKLTVLTGEAHNAKQRSVLVGADERDANDNRAKGTLNYTTWMLAGYCNWLEVRVLAKFDRATARGSVRGMAECASIMAQFHAEQMLVQRYVASLSLFAEDGPAPAVQPPSGSAPAQVAAALAPFSDLCDLLQATLEAEVHRMCEIFSNSTQALEHFVQRVAKQRLAPALESLLLPAEMGSDDDEDDIKDKGKAKVAVKSAKKPSGKAASDEDDEEDEDGSEDEEEGEESEEEDEEEEDEEEEDSEDDEDEGMDIEHQIAAALGRGSQIKVRRRKAAWGRKAPSQAESPDLLAMRLRLLTQVHTRVMAMVAAMDTACTTAGVRNLNLSIFKEGMFVPYLANYPYPELRWLDLCYKVALTRQPHPQVSVAVGQQLIINNRDALARAATLAQGNKELCAANVRLMFHGAGPFEEMPGCLLEQLARYIIEGVEHTLQVADIRDPGARAKAQVASFYEAQAAAQAQTALAAQAAAEAAARGGSRRPNDPPLPEFPRPPPPVTRQSAADKALQFASSRLQAPLQAANGAAAIMTALQTHYSQHVEPRVSGLMGELSQCSSGLVLLLKAVEESVSMVLQKVVDTIVIQAEVSLLMHQERADFFPESMETGSPAQTTTGGPHALPRPPTARPLARPPGGYSALAGLGQPTAACLMVCAQLAAMHRVAAAALEGVNLNAFLHEVGLRMHALLVNHMQQYKYNAAGALRWKGDVTEYVDLIRGWDVAGLKDKLQGVQSLANVLVVPPESLVGLVDAGLRLDHRAALKFVMLREDFDTARVDGKTLQELFSTGSTVDHIISQVNNTR